MAITNGYVAINVVKSAMRITDDDDNAGLELAIESASRLIDNHCDRQFYQDGSATARVFVARSPHLVHVDDISTTVGLVVKTDTSGDGTFDTTWTSSDYQLEPLNGRREGVAWPYDALRAVGSYDFPVYGTNNNSEALVQVTAQWGWASVPTAVKQACVIQAVSLFKAKDAPLGVAGFGDLGGVRVSSYLHPQAKMLLAPYRRKSVLVA